MMCPTAFQRQSLQPILGSHHNDAHNGIAAKKLGRQGLSLRQGQRLAHAQQMLLNNSIVPLSHQAAADILHTTDLRCRTGSTSCSASQTNQICITDTTWHLQEKCWHLRVQQAWPGLRCKTFGRHRGLLADATGEIVLQVAHRAAMLSTASVPGRYLQQPHPRVRARCGVASDGRFAWRCSCDCRVALHRQRTP